MLHTVLQVRPFPPRCDVRRSLALLLSLAVLAGCASRGPAVSEQKSAPVALPSLAGEQRWLSDWFKGTPVVIVGDDDGNVWVEVPQPHAFDRGQSKPRPALAAVLDKVAESLRRQAAARVEVVAPPEGNDTALAATRAAKVRDYLYNRGVLSNRISLSPRLVPDLVRLKLIPGETSPM